MADFAYKPGQILLWKRSKHDPLGSFVVNSQRITNISHVSIIHSIDSNIGPILSTTGANHKIIYGHSPLSREMVGRSFYVAEQSNLTPDKWEIMRRVFDSYNGQWYGVHKVALLMAKSNIPFTGEPTRLYPWLSPISKIRHPFCSESVAAAFWSAGINICQYYPDGTKWKEEPSAITPADIYLYSCMKETKLNIVHEV